MHLGVVANLRKPETAAALRNVAQVAGKLGITLHADTETAAALGMGAVADLKEMSALISAVLVLGGDGSMLRANRELGSHGIPLAGINTGSLGYMTCATVEQVEEVMIGLRDRKVSIEERRMLAVTVNKHESPPSEPLHALNDVVVARGETGRIVSLDLSVDGRPVTTYRCDGLIVATPTGSTAYSLAAGGPIVLVDTPALVLSILAPHTLTSRPIVLPDSSELLITVSRAATPLLLSVDGVDTESLLPGESVKVTRDPHVARIVLLPGYDPFAVLRHKLGWGGSAVK